MLNKSIGTSWPQKEPSRLGQLPGKSV